MLPISICGNGTFDSGTKVTRPKRKPINFGPADKLDPTLDSYGSVLVIFEALKSRLLINESFLASLSILRLTF